MRDKTKYVLDEKDMPTAWYNVLPDLPGRSTRTCTR